MHAKIEDWKNGWFGVELGISKDEIPRLIELLEMLRNDPDQHFHLTSNYKAAVGLGDITVYIQQPEEISNMEMLGRALAPGELIDAPKA